MFSAAVPVENTELAPVKVSKRFLPFVGGAFSGALDAGANLVKESAQIGANVAQMGANLFTRKPPASPQVVYGPPGGYPGPAPHQVVYAPAGGYPVPAAVYGPYPAPVPAPQPQPVLYNGGGWQRPPYHDSYAPNPTGALPRPVQEVPPPPTPVNDKTGPSAPQNDKTGPSAPQPSSEELSEMIKTAVGKEVANLQKAAATPELVNSAKAKIEEGLSSIMKQITDKIKKDLSTTDGPEQSSGDGDTDKPNRDELIATVLKKETDNFKKSISDEIQQLVDAAESGVGSEELPNTINAKIEEAFSSFAESLIDKLKAQVFSIEM
jgi:hypothetical protein